MMNKIIEDKVTVYGVLYTPFGQFELLAPEPERNNLPYYLRDGAFSFYVLDDGFARHIIVCGDFALVPYVPAHADVTAKFEMVEGE